MKKQVLIAVILGLIAAMFVALYLISVESTYVKGAQKVKVLVSKQYVMQGTMLDETMVEENLVPKEYVQPKALQVLRDLRNQDGKCIFMAVAPIEQGEQIVTTKLSVLGMDTGISAIIPGDQRSVTLSMDGEIVNGIIKPGNRVDIVGIFEYQDKNGMQQDISITILQDILILSVGNTILGGLSAKPASGKNLIPDQSSGGSVPVSFSVTPQEGEVLTLASEKGTIKLLLRPSGDETLYETKGTKMNQLCSDIATAAPAASNQAMKAMQAKQKEIISILQKYKQ